MVKKILKPKPKIVIILGPTASGKTALGVKLAAEFNGEIISADSRQVYRGMDIGTGKDLSEYRIDKQEIPYHLIDIISPNTKFNLARYQKLALKAINDILSRGKLPIIVGGTGLYLQALADNYKLSDVKDNRQVRLDLEKKTTAELWKILIDIKPDFAVKLNNSDKNNPRRLVRYIEIISGSGDMVQKKSSALFNFLILGINIDDEKMKAKILARLTHRLDREDMISEVKALKQAGVSYPRLISFGLEYKFISYFLQNKIGREEMIEKLGNAIYRFAKKQKTWFRRWEKQGKKIEWITSLNEGSKKIKEFLKASD
jgi:tRNA dimethylallyltransferase